MRAVILLFLAAVCFTGCSRSGIGDKVIVKAIYLEYSGEYTATLLALRSAPSADTGEVTEQASYLSGQGATLGQALAAAEEKENRQVFYGQNELLLLGPELCRAGAFEACRYLAKETSGRPNMAVYGVDLAPQEFLELDQKGKDALESINQLEKKGYYKTYLYEFGAGDGQGVLPGIRLAGAKAEPLGAAVYSGGEPALVLKGSDLELAALLSGQQRELEMELELEGQAVRFQVRSPRLFYESAGRGEGLQMTLDMTGHIQKIVTPQGAAAPGPDRELEQTINAALAQRLLDIIESTYGQGNDVFRLASWLYNQDEAACRTQQAAGTLWQGKVRPECRLHLV